ncbi:MAG: PAS domain-containing protein [Rubrivivax sp.]|nr:PAS domain-containing protein [Rubrivivax sp.]
MGQTLASCWAAGQETSQLLSTRPTAAELQAAGPPLHAPLRPAPWFMAHSQPLPAGGWLITLQATDALRTAQKEAADQAERLNLARDFGRLGLWERDVRTLKGEWDREVLRFWGLDPDDKTPDFAAALSHVVEADRQSLDRAFTESRKQAGRYSARYRVRALDGTVRRIHSQWLVKAGADGQPASMLGLLMDDSEPYALARMASELESQLALAVDLGGIAIWRHDLASGRMHYSPEGWRTLGREPRPDGLTLEEARALVHPDDQPRVLASAAASMRSPHPVDVEARYLHADGSWRPQMLRRIVLRDDAGQPTAFLGVALDLTERQEERRRAGDMARRFETVTRAAGIGHWILEPGQKRAVWSDQLREVFGLAADAPVPSLSDWMANCVHPDDLGLLKRTMQQWLQGGADNIELSFRGLRADGEVRELFSHSQMESGQGGRVVFGVLIDLTERRRSEQALKNAEERVALAVRAAGLGTWELDLRTRQVHWDAQMWRLRGVAPREQAMSDAERDACLHPQDRERASRTVDQAIASGGTIEHAFRVVWPDGQVRWLASRSMEIQIPGSSGKRRIGVNWDITDSRTAETVRQEREIALRESASKSKFLARMSHELRTPLNAVLGFSQLLLNDERGSDELAGSRRRRLDHIRSAGEHLLKLINDVLDLSGLEGGEVRIALQPVALQPLVEHTLPMLGHLMQQHQVQIGLGPLDLRVMADATRLRQVLLNLLSNAVKYNRPAGSVRVEARSHEGRVLLRVSDTGRGMNEAQLRQLFEPFNRLGADREAIEGSGIGLAIVKALMERMGGSVQVQSQPGEGSVFELNLGPASAAAAALTDTALVTAMPTPLAQAPSQRTVLYIEDNPVNALIIAELMARRRDLALHVAPDGASGVSQARHLQPDLILLDMQLPDFDGYEVLRRLREQPQTAAIPCIALSANAMPEDIERALRSGVSDYWTKPLDFKAFMASLDTLFGKSP